MISDSTRSIVVAPQPSGKLERLAVWVGAGLASAFFTSLERCSCINLNTTDAEEDEEANDRPLIPVLREPVQPERLITRQILTPKQIEAEHDVEAAFS